jgi:transposase-like protein
MSIAYPPLIQEDIGQLHAAEKAARDKARADRVRLLRFLKEGRVASVSQAADLLGYRVRTLQRWWQCYREGGLAALLAPPQRRGMTERLTPEAWAGLQAEMRAGHIGGLHEAQVDLRDNVASRLRHRRPFQAVPAPQDQAEDRPPAPPQGRQPRRAGGVQKMSWAPRSLNSRCSGSSRWMRPASA